MRLLNWLSRISAAICKYRFAGTGAPQQSKSPPEESTADDLEPGAWRFTGTLVRDVDMGHRYPGFVSRDYAGLAWGAASPEPLQLISFRVPEAIVTQAYMVIDPARGELFINQTYAAVQTFPWISAPQITGKNFTLVSEGVLRLTGRIVVIGGPFERNYFHWVTNWGPRLSLAKELVPEVWDDPEAKFLIDIRAKEEPFISFLRALAIPAERIIWADCFATDYQIEEAVIISFPPNYPVVPELYKAFAKAVCGGVEMLPATGRRRRIWISRQALPAPRRRVVNMEDIAPVLERFGFEDLVLEHMSAAEQIRVFAEAEVVMGVHGAGFVNMIFCPQDCRIAMIETRFNVKVGFTGFFTTLAQGCGLSYDSIVAKDPADLDFNESNFGEAHNADVEIEVADLVALIERVCAASGPNPRPIGSLK